MTALVHTSHIASVFGFRYSAFGFRLSAFGLLLAAFGFRLSASGFRLLASSVQLPLSAFGFRRLDPQPRTSLRLMSRVVCSYLEIMGDCGPMAKCEFTGG